MKQHIEAYWAQNGRSEKLMLSFHGIPQKHHDDGDPYPDECHHTAKRLAQALGLSEQEYIVSFQSQFGKSQWVKPSTQALFDQLPKQGTTKLDVFCPGFLADCLETMEEIAIMGREQFHAAGGKEYRYLFNLSRYAGNRLAIGLKAGTTGRLPLAWLCRSACLHRR